MTVSQTPAAAAPVRNGPYQDLLRQRNSFTISMTVLFMVLYLLLPLLAGYDKPLMASKIYGNVTFGYLFAFAEFIMGWVMAYVYIVKARTFDRLAREAQQ